MATTYGAPTGLDLSGCSVTATGGSTSVTLADLTKSVNDSATAVSTANTVAASANNVAADAESKATAATTAISNLNNTYIPQSAIGNVSGGVVQIYTDGTAIIPAGLNSATAAGLNFGYSTQPINNAYIFYTSSSSAAEDVLNWVNPDGTSTFGRYLDGAVLTGRSSGSLGIGNANQPINTVYAQNATVVTSDETTKTIIGRLTDTSYADGQKLIAALATVKPTVYQLNSSITEKGAANARYHVGYIAQDVEAAITAAGLDPAKFALWTKTALFTVTQNKDKTYTQAADVDSSGNQKYIQMLRYEEIFPVILAGISASIVTLNSKVSDMETKIANLGVSTGTNAGSSN